MSTVNIEGYQFDLASKVRLVTPTGKFWEADLDGRKMHLRVGKLKGGAETNLEETSKTYPTPELARASVIEKIKEKLVKGYVLEGGLKEAPKDPDDLKRDPTADKASPKSEPPKHTYAGQLFEKAGEAVKLEVAGNRVRISRTGTDGRVKEEVKTFDGSDEAVKYCKDEEDWLAGENYKPNPAKFTNSFVDDSKPSKPTAPKSASNYLSITAMTDDAISRSSRDRSAVALSPTKSSRSARDDDDENDYSNARITQNPAPSARPPRRASKCFWLKPGRIRLIPRAGT